MDADPEGVIALEHLYQCGRDPLREDDRRFGADPDQLHVRYPPQVREKPFQLFVAQCQRIASGEEDVPHLRVRRDVSDALFPLFGIQAVVALVSDHPRTGAVAAVGRAVPRHEKQHAVRIAVDNAGNRTVLIFVERIIRLAAAPEVLVNRRYDRPAQRLPRIPRIEKACIVGGNRQRERIRLTAHRMSLIFRQMDHPPQRLHIADAVAKLPVPILPFLEGCVREETLPEGPRPAIA